MSKKKKIYLALVIILAIAWVGIFKSRQTEIEAGPEEKVTPKVKVQIIETQDEIRIPIILNGKVKPKKYTLVKSLTNGFLQYITPIGEEVWAGQELFRIYDDAIETNYYNALSSLMTAEENLREVEAASEESVKQAELGVKSAEAGLSLAKVSLASAKNSAEQAVKTALDSGRASYSSAYSAIDQMMRFLGGGIMGDYAFKNLLNSNSQARTDAENSFMRVKGLYAEEIEKLRNREETRNKTFGKLPFGPEGLRASNGRFCRKQETRDDDYDDGEIEGDLEEMDELIEKVKKLADLAYVDLNYCMSTIEISDAVISNYKIQLSGLLISLNTVNSGIKGAVNGIRTAKISAESAIETAEIQSEQAENGLESARASLELAISGIELRELGAQAQFNGAQAQFDLAKYQFDNLGIPAKFSGVVFSNLVEVGDQVSIGTPVMEMGDVDFVEIELEIGTREVRYLTIGQEVKILEIRNKKQETRDDDGYVGILTEIGPAALGASGKVKIKVEADNSDYQFVPGEVAEVEIELTYKRSDMIILPLATVVVGQNESYAWIVETRNKKQETRDANDQGVSGVNKRIVEVGEVYGEMVEIVSGLDEGDLVVVENGGFLSEGDEVMIEE
ncbi:efflux RND transporter periplasmic adaptor subunit [Patescibacteria group bacterium]|nr:efflux RND transporter periplasmic adaptor subunit [Patescibacteria group bacterium]